MLQPAPASIVELNVLQIGRQREIDLCHSYGRRICIYVPDTSKSSNGREGDGREGKEAHVERKSTTTQVHSPVCKTTGKIFSPLRVLSTSRRVH
jgi:hypothetical protein